MKGYRFKEGESVAHIDQLGHKMVVSRILYQFRKPKPLKDQGEQMILAKRYMIGIECRWWVDNAIRKEKFHSRELVPFHVAQQGREIVLQWLEDIKK